MTSLQERRYENESNSSRGYCSAQACCSYLVILISGILIFLGLFLAYIYWQITWLVVSAIGIFLLFIGNCMFYCMVDKKNSKKSQQRARIKHHNQNMIQIPLHENEDFLPTAPLHNAFSSASQLCLLPAQVQGSFDEASIVTGSNPPSVSQTTYNQIVLNGQNFLLVPMKADGSIADTSSLVGRPISQLEYLNVDVKSHPENFNNPQSLGNLRSRNESQVPDPNQQLSMCESNVTNASTVTNESQAQSRPTQISSSVNASTSSNYPKAGDQLYVTLLSDDRVAETIPIESSNVLGDSSPMHSSCSESAANFSAEESSANDSPSGDSNTEVSSNASTIIENPRSHVGVFPSLTVQHAEASSNHESQDLPNRSEFNVSDETQAIGGATGLNVNHPDYVSVSDDDSVLCGRSSPPPSYAEVAKEDGFPVV